VTEVYRALARLHEWRGRSTKEENSSWLKVDFTGEAVVTKRSRSMVKHMGIVLLATVIGALCLEVGEKMSIPGIYGVVSPANAVIGRPGTPRSVAGVARRTYRRCAAGVYRC
jgi:hypothetical protein